MQGLTPEQKFENLAEQQNQLKSAESQIETERDLDIVLWLQAENRHNLAEASGELARSRGHVAVDGYMDDNRETYQAITPKGFEKVIHKPKGALVELARVRESVKSLALPTETETLEMDVDELETENGFRVRLVDLRPFMSAKVQKGGPNPDNAKKLDEKFYEELKFFAENNGVTRNTVSGGVKGLVGYTKLGGTKCRSYYMPVSDGKAGENVRTVARIADCGDSIAAESALYRRVFAAKL